MCVSLVCVLALFRASVCAFRVSELLVVRLSFVVKLFRLRCVSCEIPKFSIRISSSSSLNFRVEFRIRVSLSSLPSNFRFEFRVQVPWIFVSNFEFVFFVSLLYSTSRNRSSNSTSQISIFDSNFEFKFLEFDDSTLSSKFSLSCSIRFLEFRFESFVALFDFSKFDFSKFDFSSQVPWISNSSWSIRLLELWWLSSSRICRRNCRFRVAFFIWVLHRTSQLSLLVD